MRTSTGPELFSGFELVAGGELAVACIGNAIRGTIDGLHFGSDSRRDLPIGFVGEEREDQKCETGSCCQAERLRGPGKCAFCFRERPVQRCSRATAEPAEAGATFAQVIVDQQTACAGESSGPIGGEQLLDVATVLDDIDLRIAYHFYTEARGYSIG